MRVTPPPSAFPATIRWAGRTPSAAMGALEEAHLAAIAACGCDEEDLLAELGVGAAMLVGALAAVSVVLVPAVTAQTGSCDDALPPELVGNYSGLACSPVWNNFVLRCFIGYAICSACHGMLLNKDKCHVCSITGGYNRCIVLEKILEPVQAACSNTKYGQMYKSA